MKTLSIEQIDRLDDIKAEIESVSETMLLLHTSLGDEQQLPITKEAAQRVIWGICSHLDRVTNELYQIVNSGSTVEAEQ